MYRRQSVYLSGNRVMLPPSRPLRTARTSFPKYSYVNYPALKGGACESG
jgi:hypothetical protein